MIRTLIAHRAGLVRGALAFVLSTMDDIEVVAQLDRGEDVEGRMAAMRPDVSVIHLDLLRLAGLPAIRRIRQRLPECHVLILAESHRSSGLVSTVARQAPDLSFMAEDVAPEILVDGVRRTAHGEQVVDPELVVAGLRRARSPLTLRETEVLRVTAGGEPVKDVAERLRLSPGTVRNHLSRIIAKTGARSRIEAIRIADEAGWI